MAKKYTHICQHEKEILEMKSQSQFFHNPASTAYYGVFDCAMR